MSYVVTIKRAASKEPISAADIATLVQHDSSLSHDASGAIKWTDPSKGQVHYLGFADACLSCDSVGIDATGPATLDKLRSIAASLDAGVFGEEGEDLSSPDPAVPPPSKSLVVFGILFSIALLPFVALVFLARLPLLVWQILRPK